MRDHRPRLTPFRPLLMVRRIEQLGWTPIHAADATGVSRATAYKWLGRFRGDDWRIVHASGDTPGFFVHLTSRAYDINVAITVVVAILFVLVLGATNLSRSAVRSTIVSA